ncbi:MAG TPA: FAD:protein FMN transferase [Gammaproteobacteria bacterium]
MASNAGSPAMQRRMKPLLGTFVEIAIVEMERGDTALTAAFAAIERIQALLSFHDAESELSRLNRQPGTAVKFDAISLRVLRLARAMTLRSNGLFNCTVGGALVAHGTLPDHGGVAALPCGRADDIVIGSGYALLRRPLRITLDGIAKGYAVDCAVRVLQAHGACSGWVNAGGDLRCFGETVLPVQRREVDGSLTLLGGVQNGALATSAVYPQRQGSFPSHIVRDGEELQEHGAWSVLARTAWRADALTKVAALAPAQQRAALIQQLGGRLV